MSQNQIPAEIPAQIATLIKSNAELQVTLANNLKSQEDRDRRQEQRDAETQSALNKLVESQTQMQIALTKTEERQAADRDWQKGVEKHQDKQDDLIARNQQALEAWKEKVFNPVRDAVRDNSKFVNKWVGIGGVVIGACITSGIFYIPKLIKLLG
jgi:chromosome segregation ATPase